MIDTFLTARWENLIMANYQVPPSLLMPYLPAGVELDYHQTNAYISLVGFMFKQTSLLHIPIPFLGTFEEINLRFYVKRKDGENEKRGVVFINETVPYKSVAWLANKLYKEHYMAIPTKNSISTENDCKHIQYDWKINNTWNHIAANTAMASEEMKAGKIEEFIFEHYFGYTKLNESVSQEYKVNHPRWKINKVLDYSINCDFTSMYGDDFAFLQHQQPASVIVAEGSNVSVNWKREKF